MAWLVIGELGLEETCVPCHVCPDMCAPHVAYDCISSILEFRHLGKPLGLPFSPSSHKAFLGYWQVFCCLLKSRLCRSRFWLLSALGWIPALSSCPLLSFPSPQRKSVTTLLDSRNQIRSNPGYAMSLDSRTVVGVSPPCFVVQWTTENLFVYHSQLLPTNWDVGAACTQGRQGLLKDPGVLWTQSRGALFSVTASYSVTHGPSQGDNKLCNCRIKQWMKGRRSWMLAWLWNVSMRTSATWQRKGSNNGEPPAGSPTQCYLGEQAWLFKECKCSFYSVYQFQESFRN